jgi:hypothetical protein
MAHAKPKVKTPKDMYLTNPCGETSLPDGAKTYGPDAQQIYADIGCYPKYDLGETMWVNEDHPFGASVKSGDIVTIESYSVVRSKSYGGVIYDIRDRYGDLYYVGEQHLGIKSANAIPAISSHATRKAVEAKVGKTCRFKVGDRVRVLSDVPDGADYAQGDLIYITGYSEPISHRSSGAAYYTNRLGDTGDALDLMPYWVTEQYLELWTTGIGALKRVHPDALLMRDKGLALPKYSIGDELRTTISNPNGTVFQKGDKVFVAAYDMGGTLSRGLPVYSVSATPNNTLTNAWVEETYLQYERNTP